MSISDRLEKLADHMAQQLRLRRGTLGEMRAAARRRLPFRVASALDTLVEAEERAGHPKLACQIDERAFQRAERKVMGYLDRRNPTKERIGEVLDRVAAIAFVLVVGVLVVFFVLLSRGYFDTP